MVDAKSSASYGCILFATADWDEPYWTNKQHSARALAELGIQVLYVESVGLRTPMARSPRDWRRLRDRMIKGISSMLFGAQERSPDVRVMSPLTIPGGHRNQFVRKINHWLLNLSLQRSLRGRLADNPVIWTYHPFMLGAIDGILSATLLYHCVDDLGAVPGVDAGAFREAEDVLLRRADVVFATAPALAERCKSINANTHFLPNVVDVDHFAVGLLPGSLPDDLASIPEPRLGYHGVLSDYKIDFQLLLDIARLRPVWQFVFIGEEREGQKNHLVAELQKLSNVHFLGYRPYQILPEYLRGISVGLLPSLLTEYTRSMFPMKYFEYIAAGIPIVSTALDFSRSTAHGIVVADNVEAFVSGIEDQLCRGRLSSDEIADFIGDNTWKCRTSLMLKSLGERR